MKQSVGGIERLDEVGGPPVTRKTLPERSGISLSGEKVVLLKKGILRWGKYE